MTDEKPIPGDEWRTIVENVPIVAVDLVVRRDEEILLGRRTNEPARGEWFVPGGRILKGEGLEEAVHRIAREELGVEVEIDRRLGVYEHRWDESELDGIDEKHYVPVGYLVSTAGDPEPADEQHDEFRWFADFEGVDLHPFVADYLRDAGRLD